MGNFEIFGESESLSAKQIDFVYNVLEERGFKGSKVFIEALGKPGDNYGANVKRITVKNDDDTIIFKMIAKIAPTSEFLRKMLSTDIMFPNENTMYQEVFPKFREIEMAAGIPEDDIFLFPTCYGNYSEEKQEIILLEDLSEKNFVMANKSKPLTNEEVILIFKSFAKLHALSFALRKNDSLTYRKVAEKLIDTFSTPHMKSMVEEISPQLFEILDSLLNSNEKINIIKDIFNKLMDKARKIKELDTGSEYSVIVHGDAWINNILFQLKGDIKEKCVFVDYQLSEEKSPVQDLHHLINNCTDYKARTNLTEWINVYHEELGKRLSYFDMDVNCVYPKEKLWEDYRRYIDLAVGRALLLVNVFSIDTKEADRLKGLMSTSDNLEDIRTEFKTEDLNHSSLDLIRKRVEELLDSFYLRPLDIIRK